MLAAAGDRMSAVMLSSGQRDSVTTEPNPPTSGQSPIAPRRSANTGTAPVFGPLYSEQYAATGPT